MIVAVLRRARMLVSRGFPGSVILMYHRIDDPPADSWGNCVRPENFAQHMELLARLKLACPLAGIQRRVRGIAVTLDDGYADNLYVAKPILERFGIPATVFVVTGNCQQTSFWWDELELIFLKTVSLPAEPLVLEVEGQEQQWTIDRRDLQLRPGGDSFFRHWIAWRDDPPTSRHAVFRSVWMSLRNLEHTERDRKIEDIRRWAHCPVPTNGARRMTRTELSRIGADRLVELGVHTMTHPRLSALSLTDQSREIVDSRNQLSQITGRLPQSFSYPFGGPGDYNAETVNVVRHAGFERACSTRGGAVRFWNDPFQLPRAHVEDMDGERFARWIREIMAT